MRVPLWQDEGLRGLEGEEVDVALEKLHPRSCKA